MNDDDLMKAVLDIHRLRPKVKAKTIALELGVEQRKVRLAFMRAKNLGKIKIIPGTPTNKQLADAVTKLGGDMQMLAIRLDKVLTALEKQTA